MWRGWRVVGPVVVGRCRRRRRLLGGASVYTIHNETNRRTDRLPLPTGHPPFLPPVSPLPTVHGTVLYGTAIFVFNLCRGLRQMFTECTEFPYTQIRLSQGPSRNSPSPEGPGLLHLRQHWSGRSPPLFHSLTRSKRRCYPSMGSPSPPLPYMGVCVCTGPFWNFGRRSTTKSVHHGRQNGTSRWPLSPLRLPRPKRQRSSTPAFFPLVPCRRQGTPCARSAAC